MRRSTERVGSLGEGGRRSPVSHRGVLGRRYGCGPGRGSGVRHMGGLEPGFICPGAHLLGDTAGAAGPLGARSSPTVMAPHNLSSQTKLLSNNKAQPYFYPTSFNKTFRALETSTCDEAMGELHKAFELLV